MKLTNKQDQGTPKDENEDNTHITLTIQASFGNLEIRGTPESVQKSIPTIISILKEVGELYPAIAGINQKQTTLTDIPHNREKTDPLLLSSHSSTWENNVTILNRTNPRSLTGRIQSLYDESFFSSPQTAENVRKQLEQRGYHYEARRISSELTRSFVRRNIMRRLGSRGTYQYVKK